jgi:hypothetical protein
MIDKDDNKKEKVDLLFEIQRRIIADNFFGNILIKFENGIPSIVHETKSYNLHELTKNK